VIASIDDWLALDRATPAPSFFARPAFALALHDAYPRMDPRPFCVQLRDGEYVVPIIRTYAPLGLTHAVAFPLGGYSCVLDDCGRPADGEAATEVLGRIAQAFHAVEFTGWPLGAQPSTPGWSETELKTAVIDCAGGRDAALSTMRGVTRRMAAQSLRRGVECVLATPDERSLSAYYEMLEESSAGWGLTEPTISRRLLHAVFARAGSDAELWFALADGTPIAGGVVLYGAQELFFWSAAMRRDFGRLRPSNALNVRLIERACERGVRWYNLGASEGLSGVERFKHDLGARDVPYRRLQHRGHAATLYRGLRTMLRGEAVRS
jgi:hypothetical protein